MCTRHMSNPNPISVGLQVLCLVTTDALNRLGAHSVVLRDEGLAFGLPPNRHAAQQIQITQEGLDSGLYRVQALKMTWNNGTALEALVVYGDQVGAAIEALTDLCLVA